MKMLTGLALLAVTLLYCPQTGLAARTPKAQATPVVLAVSATSSSENSSPLTCLLEPDCRGGWTPQSEDQGVNEGVYLRFQEPTAFNFMEITVEGNYQDALQLQTYLDARSSLPKSKKKAKKRDAPDMADTADAADQRGIVTYFVSYDEAGVGRTVFLLSAYDDEEGSGQPLRHAARSVFIKIAEMTDELPAAPKITSIRFFDQESYDPQQAPMKLVLPVTVKAMAAATSTLEPAFAYDVSRLFDSQTDMAWSTNGKKNRGVGESVTLSFDEEQSIAGLVVWNGYQRSDVHFRANGRVKSLQVENMSLRLKDGQGPQTVMLPAPVNSRNLTLRINDIYPGGSYKDVLISELRLLTSDGRILIPLVQPPAPDIPAQVGPIKDATYASFLHNVMYSDQDFDQEDEYYDLVCLRSTMRMRGNGSFVIYTDDADSIYTGIVEGNWEPVEGQGLRLFGKRYAAELDGMRGAYLPEGRSKKSLPAPRIFQSSMKVGKFVDMSEFEQKNMVGFLLQDLKKRGLLGEVPENIKSITIISSVPDKDRGEVLWAVGGRTEEEAASHLVKKLRDFDALYVVSDVYTNVLLPLRKAGPCY